MPHSTGCHGGGSSINAVLSAIRNRVLTIALGEVPDEGIVLLPDCFVVFTDQDAARRYVPSGINGNALGTLI